MESMTDYLLLDVVKWLSRPRDVVAMAMTCKRFSRVVSSNMQTIVGAYASEMGRTSKVLTDAVDDGYMPWVRETLRALECMFIVPGTYEPQTDVEKVRLMKDSAWREDVGTAFMMASSKKNMFCRLYSATPRLIRAYSDEPDAPMESRAFFDFVFLQFERSACYVECLREAVRFDRVENVASILAHVPLMLAHVQYMLGHIYMSDRMRSVLRDWEKRAIGLSGVIFTGKLNNQES